MRPLGGPQKQSTDRSHNPDDDPAPLVPLPIEARKGQQEDDPVEADVEKDLRMPLGGRRTRDPIEWLVPGIAGELDARPLRVSHVKEQRIGQAVDRVVPQRGVEQPENCHCRQAVKQQVVPAQPLGPDREVEDGEQDRQVSKLAGGCHTQGQC